MKKGMYRHYKSGKYEVIDFGFFEPTEEEVVIYKQLYDTPKYPIGTIWVRPKKVFKEEIETEGRIVKRFEKI